MDPANGSARKRLMKYLTALIAALLVMGGFGVIINALGPGSIAGNIAAVGMGLAIVVVVRLVLKQK